MSLNETKWGVLKVTRNLKPCSHLTISTTITLPTQRSSVKGLFKKIFSTADLKWKQQVSAVCAKANRMLGFVKRSSINMHDPRTRTALYKTLASTKSFRIQLASLVPAVCVFTPRSREDSKTCNEIHPIAAV